MKWLEIQVKTTSENEDIITDILYSSGASGLAIEDPNDVVNLSLNESDWDFIDINLLELKMEGILIKAYFSEEQGLEDKVKWIKHNIEENTGGNLGTVIINEVDDEDWSDNWKKYYKPTKIGDRIIIKPSWEEYEAKGEELIIELDPGMAFGTGTHESTILCAEALDNYVSQSTVVFDVGCGSGILSIVAAKLGAPKVTAIDLDELCIKVSKENAIINNVEQFVEIKQGNLLDVIDTKADIIVANIIAEVIVILAKDVKDYLNPGGLFISSGIIIEKIPMVENALKANGFKIVEIKKMNGWAGIIASII